MFFQHFIPVRILFGEGSLKRIARESLPGSKALIVTGGSSTTKLGYIDRLQELLQKNRAHVESIVYRDVMPNPTLRNVEKCAALARKHNCDFLIALGGGSSIDTAKAAALLLANGGELWDYAPGGTGGCETIPNKPLPVIAIPTTAGTGSEADPWMVVTNEKTSEKIGLGNSKTFPVLSIVDPELMYSVPPQLAAFQGFDAFFHAVEGYLSVTANPVSDLYALKSIALIGDNLKAAVAPEPNPEAVAQVALASTLSGLVEAASSCTSHHAMEHALSALHPRLPHGAGLIMLSMAYFRHFAPLCPERFSDMAKAMRADTADGPAGFLSALEKLQEACGVAGLKMSDYGITPQRFGEYADNAMETGRMLFACDRTPLEREDVIAIYEQSYRQH